MAVITLLACALPALECVHGLLGGAWSVTKGCATALSCVCEPVLVTMPY